MVQADYIAPTDPHWPALLARVKHDVYHLPHYATVSARHEGERAVAFWAREGANELLIPLIVRDLPANLGAAPEWNDAVSPYGYPAPLVFQDPEDPEALSRLLQAFVDLSKERGLISAFVRLNPLLPAPLAALAQIGFVATYGDTVYVDLKLPEETLAGQVRRDHRQRIRQLRRNGFITIFDNWDFFADFKAVYARTMQRVAAADYYFFAGSYFEDLRTELGESLHLCTVVAPSGQVACASLFTETCGLVQYFLSGTADEYLRLAPSKLLLQDVIVWAKARGWEKLHLGGGVNCKDDSLFQFKQGFSRLTSPYRCLQVVFQEGHYKALAKGLGLNTEAAPLSYFPRYRSALVVLHKPPVSGKMSS